MANHILFIQTTQQWLFGAAVSGADATQSTSDMTLTYHQLN